ncbi:wax ester/triacylglycerol synthase domain-containing protein [Mycobacterium sp.]|uniref:wax ester/triacylglycerol synthase domain-containing protein n=1 Tax=Mycobacterium sp. TaxID=1785 RepID=UPI003D6A0D68
MTDQTVAEANLAAWSKASGWGRSPRMTEFEALMWRSERHPQQSSTILSVMVLDTTPDWDRLVAAHEWGTALVARTRQRVLEPAVPVGPPAWVLDDHFELGYHLQRARLPGDGSMRSLLDHAAAFGMAPLDRHRPLWEAQLVEGLADGRAAYLLKMHHSLTDGMGGIELLSSLQSRTREHTPDKPRPKPDANGDSGTDAIRLAVNEAGERLLGSPRVAAAVARSSLGLLLRPADAVGETLRYIGSLRRVLSPPPATPSPLLKARTGRMWRYGVLECPLAQLKSVGKTAGGSVNDAFVAALLGGLRIYHERHGVELERLPMAMPVSLRKTDDPMGGNKWAGALFAAPIGIADPQERIAAIRGTVLSLRTEPALDTFSLVAPLVNRLPSTVGAMFARLGAAADLSASNVPGLPYQTYLAGAKVERVYPFGPLPGVAVMAAMVSHAGTCCFGLNIDGAAVADVDVLMDCFRAGLAETTAVS